MFGMLIVTINCYEDRLVKKALAVCNNKHVLRRMICEASTEYPARCKDIK
jgi:hypothetical protein